jgi:DNA-directed RNA polymerase subunit RPC12/RpoP
MTDMFDEIVVCSGCGKKMQRIDIIKNGFRLRALQCDKCEKRIFHPADIEEYKRFSQLKQRPFAVKLRMVGNSYTVSIPREIVDFMNEQDGMHQRFMKIQNDMVRVFFEEFGKISLTFAQPQQKEAMREEDEKINLKNKKLKVLN